MKRIIAVALASVLSLPIISTVTVVVHAEESTTPSSSSSTTSESSTGTSTTATTKTASEASNDAKAIADRIAQKKAELKTKLSNAEKTKLKAKCQASQGVLSTVKGRVNGLETSRSVVYKNLLARLNNLSERLKAKGVDTTTLNADIAMLKTKVDTFNTDLASYKQAVSDVAAMDCASDPDGFKAALEAARTALKKVNDDAAAVRTYLSGTIKPLLQTIRSDLEKANTTTTDTTNSSTTTGGN